MELGDLLEKFKENNLAKVNCLKLQTQEKPSRMFSLAYNLPKTMSNFCPSKLRQKKYVETTWIFRPSKLHRKEYVETMWIFRPSKLHPKKYV